MVFGWGKKKQEENTVEVISQNKEIQLSDVSKILTELNQLRSSQILSEIKQIRKITEPLIDDLIKIGKVLEKDNLKVDDIDKHLAIIVVRGKKQVIDVIKKGVTSLPEISSLEDMEKLNYSLTQILKKVGDVLGRQTRVIHIFAKKYANQLKDNLEVMNHNHSEIQQLLKNFKSTKSDSIEINDSLNKIKLFQNTKIDKAKKIIETHDAIKSLEGKILSIDNSIKETKSSDNYKKYLVLKKEFDEYAPQKLKIKNIIDTQFTKISRPLSRYEYASSLDKEQKTILTKLVENPFNILLSENKDHIILILENVRKGITSGSISVKDVDKTLSHITETEEILDNFIKQVSNYFETSQKMQNELNSLMPDELVSLEREHDKNISFKDDLQLKSEILQGDIDDAETQIPTLISEIEKKLREFSNTKYTILQS
ncbi:MAG: exonuclease SbcC [Thaumarchaeota archaeon]|nr:MAG: exonuclease SbcC [Nitrososphaerota archaeon]